MEVYLEEKEENFKGKDKRITKESIGAFESYLRLEEKAGSTVRKYVAEVERFAVFLDGGEIQKEKLILYRELLHKRYQACTVNGKLSALNAYLVFTGNSTCRVRFLKVQHSAFIDEKRELEEKEYKRLLLVAKEKKKERLYYILLTISGTGIRVGELKYITVEAVRLGRAEINLKGKNRVILLPKSLREELKKYAARVGISGGPVFVTRTGTPLDRSNICHDMKKLCAEAKVRESKVFPHNLRHLFARKYFEIDKNLPHLADILGHSSIETTRIYIAASAREHEKVLEKMKLI